MSKPRYKLWCGPKGVKAGMKGVEATDMVEWVFHRWSGVGQVVVEIRPAVHIPTYYYPIYGKLIAYRKVDPIEKEGVSA